MVAVPCERRVVRVEQEESGCEGEVAARAVACQCERGRPHVQQHLRAGVMGGQQEGMGGGRGG